MLIQTWIGGVGTQYNNYSFLLQSTPVAREELGALKNEKKLGRRREIHWKIKSNIHFASLFLLVLRSLFGAGAWDSVLR